MKQKRKVITIKEDTSLGNGVVLEKGDRIQILNEEKYFDFSNKNEWIYDLDAIDKVLERENDKYQKETHPLELGIEEYTDDTNGVFTTKNSIYFFFEPSKDKERAKKWVISWLSDVLGLPESAYRLKVSTLGGRSLDFNAILRESSHDY